MLVFAPNATGGATSSIGPSTTGPDRAQAPRRIDAIEVRLRRLVDSSEPAVVFSSLIRLCVPSFSDACWVDLVEGGRMGYRVSYPLPMIDAAPPASSDPTAQQSVVTVFRSDLPGWPSYAGAMTSLWHTRPSTVADEQRAAAIVEHAIRMIRSERLADPVRSGRAVCGPRNERRSQLRSR